MKNSLKTLLCSVVCVSFAVLNGCSSGVSTPGGVLSATSLTFGDTLVGATTAAQTVTLTNNGNAPTTVTGVSLSGAGFAQTNTCNSTLPVNASCTISVTFSPTATTNYSGTITVADNVASGVTKTVSLTGNGITRLTTLSSAALAFPNTLAGSTSAALSSTVTNSGSAPVAITAVALTGSNFTLTANTCVTTLAAGATCSVSATFAPTSATPFTGQITFTDNATNTPQTIALSGTGTTPGVSFSATTLAFPSTVVGGTASAMSTTLTNTGTGPLNITGVALGGTNAADFTLTGTTCTGTIAAGGTCTITATFTPVGAANYSATITVTDNGAGGSQGVSLTGTGLVPGATFSPAALAFPNTVYGAVPSTLSVTVTSSGQSPLTFGATATISGTGASFSIPANTCAAGTTLAVGSTCKITVAFAPIAVASFAATLNIFDNVLNGSGTVPQTVALSGTGTLVPSPNSCKTTNTTSPAQPTPTSNYTSPAFTGTVKAGSAGVAGAKVQVYSAGTAGNGSAPVALLATPLTTDANGNFTLAGAITCPLSNSVLYAVATGGSVGSGGTANAGIALMSVLGVCSKLTSGARYTINEATTVAAAYAMSQFLATGAKIGATATNAGGLALAAGSAANLVNVTTGAMPGTYFPTSGTAPTAKMGAVANMLNACVAGGATSSACTGLYAATTTATVTPANTLDAAMNLAKQPGANVATLYTLSGGSNAYASVAAAPSDWTMYVTYAGGGMNDPTAISIDSTGLVWVANYFGITSLFNNTGTPLYPTGLLGGYTKESYGGAVNVNDQFWQTDEQTSYSQNTGNGGVTAMTNTGNFLAIYLAGGIYFPTGVAFDPSGIAWLTAYGDTNAGVVLLGPTGTPLSGTLGYGSSQFDFPVAVATDSLCNGFLANQSGNTITKVSGDGSAFTSFAVGNGPSGIAVDQSGNAWSANYYDDSVGLMSVGGPVVSAAGYKGGGISHPQGIAVDGVGNVWVANYRGPSLSELAGAAASKPGTALAPSVGWAPDSNMIESFGLAIDAAGNVWVSNFGTNTLTEFVGMAAPVKTPLLGGVRVP